MVLALGAAAPLALAPHAAHAAPRLGRPRGGPVIPAKPTPSSTPAAEAPYAPGVVVVGYASPDPPSARAAIARAAGAVDPVEVAPRTRLLTLAPHASVSRALAHLRHTRGVAWAVPDYIAHAAVMPASHATAVSSAEAPGANSANPLAGIPLAEDPTTPTGISPEEGSTTLAGISPEEGSTTLAGISHAEGSTTLTGTFAARAAPTDTPPFGAPAATAADGREAGHTSSVSGTTTATAAAAGEPFPNDPGLAKTPGGWSQLQWNFVGTFGVEAPGAWEHLIADHAPGGQGVTVAVLDTGVAYANRGHFRLSPDFYHYQFVKGYDFVAHTPYPNDRNGHGTDVAGTIAEATDNGIGLTGLAYGVRIMPVRVLDSEGNGDAATIAKGVRFAVNHGARVINLSLEFPGGITASDIPELISALRYANRHRVVVVAAAGNEAHAAAAYPARAPNVIAVGATTEHGCLASYSNFGTGVTLVAPGGGPDADLPGDPNCQPNLAPGRDIFQVTFLGTSPRRFGIPNGYEGTSMATPHVAATAALIIASGVLGRHPTPARIAARLRATARPLGGPSDSRLYGAGLLDAAAATAPGGPGAVGGG